MSQRNEKIGNLIKELAARFLNEESNRTSLVTVTDCSTSSDLKRATVFFTVLPTDKEEVVLEFAKRKRTDFRNFIKKNMKSKLIPFIDFAIDKGEKNRQKIDGLLREK
jgi:ribosome-binding factor A